jgi:hypothetical protein
MQQAIARVMAFAALRAGNETANVHSAAVVILGNSKATATTARDDKHAKLFTAFRFVFICTSLHFVQVRLGTGLSPSPPERITASRRDRHLATITLPPRPAISSAYSIAEPSSAAATISA